ncbi:hypothetical protein FQN50_002878 [Emmonsiellopsis sp. PD_5]|nr:hypothetical protein FQN50_002878 [Emmonsiellopsis sp. PD_5]
MDPIKYEPFEDAQEFSDLMQSLFKLFGLSEYATYPFSFLQKSEDVKIICDDATSKKVEFVTPAGLEDALQESEMINSPKTNSGIPGAPDDSSWAGWTLNAIGSLLDGIDHSRVSRGESMFDGPLLGVLYEGLVAGSHRRVVGYRLYRHRPQHWALMIRDHTPLDSKKKDAKDYFLQSEILGITAIFYRQMNEIKWDPWGHKFLPAQLTYKDGILTATIVTFLIGKVRVVQASCDPSQEHPEFKIALKGVYDLSLSCYNKAVFHEVVKWLLCPPDPARELPLRSRKA